MSVKTQHLATHQQADGQGYVPYIKKYNFTYADLQTGKKFYIPVPAGSYVLGVIHRVVTAYTGTTPVVDIGDTDADGFVAAASVETANAVVNSLGSAAAYGNGKYYPATGTIVCDFTDDAVAGASEVLVLFAGTEA